MCYKGKNVIACIKTQGIEIRSKFEDSYQYLPMGKGMNFQNLSENLNFLAYYMHIDLLIGMAEIKPMGSFSLLKGNADFDAAMGPFLN